MMSDKYIGRLVCHTGHAYSSTGLIVKRKENKSQGVPYATEESNFTHIITKNGTIVEFVDDFVFVGIILDKYLN